MESYRTAQVKLLFIGLGIFVFLIPAFVINRISGRFENYITDTIFDWPSYLISLGCWCSLIVGVYFLRVALSTRSAENTNPGDGKKKPRIRLLHLAMVFISCVLLLAHGLEYLQGDGPQETSMEVDDPEPERATSPEEVSTAPLVKVGPEEVAPGLPADTATVSKPDPPPAPTAPKTEDYSLAAKQPDGLRKEEPSSDAGKVLQEENKVPQVNGATAAAHLKLAETKAELAALESRITTERTRWNDALGTINRLTNFKKSPVKEGSAAYQQCMEASRVIHDVEQKAPEMKAEKARLETLIEELQKHQL